MKVKYIIDDKEVTKDEAIEHLEKRFGCINTKEYELKKELPGTNTDL